MQIQSVIATIENVLITLENAEDDMQDQQHLVPIIQTSLDDSRYHLRRLLNALKLRRLALLAQAHRTLQTPLQLEFDAGP